MPSRITSLILACAILATSAPHAQDLGVYPPGWIPERPLPKPQPPTSPMPHWYEVRGGGWQPSLETVQHIASLLKARLADNSRFNPPKPDHAIQFRGEIVDGARIVRLFGMCSIGLGGPSALSDAFLEVRDGGRCVFDAEFDMAEQAIKHFSYYPQG
ncbi:hypothetical protein [Massilia sp. BKSP1R2A-1]|jgi:hypothetical protein|uniref:hypothetical protein n=1 Tax=Massilia sp. BKSP1R2A-1 TaxID=3422595 RepID=UPI003D343FA6